MNEEKKMILQMVEQGKISAEEAEQLFTEGETINQTVNNIPANKPSSKKFLRVLVEEENDTKVNVNIPLALAEVGLKLIPKDKLNINGSRIDLDEILALILQGNEGELINVDTNDNGKVVKVKVFVD